MNNEQLQALLSSMTSFYQEYIPENDQLSKLMKIYSSTLEYVWTNLEEVMDNESVLTARTLKTIPYAKLNVENALYSNNEVEALERIPFKRRIERMTKNGNYATLSFEETDNFRKPAVFYFTLRESFSTNDSLVMYEDYFIWMNRLYLLPKYVKSRVRSLNHLHAFDIKVNDYTLEKNFGNNFNLEVGALLKRHEYRDAIEAYMRTLNSRMTIRDIRRSIQSATKWENFKVEDRLSPDLSIRKKELYDDWILSPHEFIVTLPEVLISEKAKINFLHLFLNDVKESHVNFISFYEIIRRELMDTLDSRHKNIASTFIDHGFIADNSSDRFYYDNNLLYDQGGSYDKLSRNLSDTTFSVIENATAEEDSYPLFKNVNKESFQSSESAKFLPTSSTHIDYMFLSDNSSDVSYYDINFSYNKGNFYDKLEKNLSDLKLEVKESSNLNPTNQMIVDRGDMLDSVYRFDEVSSEFSEYDFSGTFLIEHIEEPEIPRDFKFDSSVSRFVCRGNDENTLYFELLRSYQKNGDYEVVFTEINEPEESEVVIDFDAFSNDQEYYRLRAYSHQDGYSLSTLPIEI